MDAIQLRRTQNVDCGLNLTHNSRTLERAAYKRLVGSDQTWRRQRRRARGGEPHDASPGRLPRRAAARPRRRRRPSTFHGTSLEVDSGDARSEIQSLAQQVYPNQHIKLGQAQIP